MTPDAVNTRLAEAEDGERRAYNIAFWQLGFRWRWDPATYRELAKIPQERDRVRAYVKNHQPHLLKAYELDFLCEMIVNRKSNPDVANAFGVNCATVS